MSSLARDDGIVRADNLWFGENGHKLINRDTSVSLFQNLHENVDTSTTMVDRFEQGEGDDAANNISHDYGPLPCENGLCCEHRRNTNQLQQQATTTPTLHNNKSVCIIGAGASGLITIKELHDKGFTNIKCYEASNQIGGAFSAAYEGATMTSSNLLTCFGCYTLSEFVLDRQRLNSDDKDIATPAADVKMWTTTEYCVYLHVFTQKFRLCESIYTSTEVTLIRKSGEQWEVHTRQSTGDRNTKRIKVIEMFDAVCICSGLHQAPNIPRWCTQSQPPSKSLQPQIIHSSQFTKKEVTNKHVLIIGLGESGSDIALMSAKVAKSVYISIKEGPSGGTSGYILPRYTKDEVGDLNTSRGYGRGNVWGPSEYRKFAALVDSASRSSNTKALKELARCFIGTNEFTPLDLMAIEWNNKFNNLPYNRFGTKNYSFLEAIHYHEAKVIGQVSAWEDVPSEVDVIVVCTGYQATFPFFDETSHPTVDLHANSPNHRDRFQHMIDVDIGPSLAFIGTSRPAFGAIPPLSEMASRYWALLLTGERTIPQDAHAQIHSDRMYEERLFSRDASRVQSLVQYHRAMDAFARLIGCFPPLKELRVNHPSIYARVIHSTLSGVQYRLAGEGNREEAWEDISKHPLPRYTRQTKNAFHTKLEAGLFGSDSS